MRRKRINIVTVNLNNKDGLERTIRSVIWQTFFKKVNYIIIDGGSTDGSLEVIDKYKEYLAYYVSEEDSGTYNAMNKAIDVCNGGYIQFLNSGDYLHSSTAIEEVYDKLDKDIVYGALMVHNGDNTYVINDDYYKNKGIPHPSCFVKSSLLKKNKFNEDYKIVADWVFFYEQICINHTEYRLLDTIVSDFFIGGASSDYAACHREKRKYFKSIADSKLKIAMCSIGRMENKYAIEFVEFYKELGVDKFFIYDNNYGEEEHFEEVLQPYINENIVEIVDYRNKSYCQVQSYQDCYDKHGKEYDWICFFDFDEYLWIDGDMTLKNLLSDKIYDGFEMLHVNELIYGDSGNILYENRPVVERFNAPVQPIDYKKTYDFPENCHIKSIIRGGLNNVQWNATPHTPSNKDLKCCNSIGEECPSNSPFVIPYVHKNIILRHYKTKSLEEFFNTKVKRGYPDGNKDFFKNNSWIVEYFSENKITKEKLDFIENELFKKEKITIIMPCYNYANYITEAIDSLKKSTYDKWKCIIVNDGSTDNSEEVIFSLIENDNRFTYIRQPNRGPSATRNLAMRATNTKYLMCFDPDDKISPTYIENGVKYLDEHDDCSLYYGKAKLFYDDGTEKDWELPSYDYKKLLVSNHIYSSCIIRKEEYDAVGGYDENLKGYEDWEFLIRLLYGGKKVYMTNDVVFYYRRHEGSIDEKAKNDIKKYKHYIYNKNSNIILTTLRKDDGK